MTAAVNSVESRRPGRPSERFAQRRGRRRAGALAFNLTPMIDVTFNLLVFFLLGTSFMQAEGSLSSRMARFGSRSNTATLPVTPLRLLIDPVDNAPGQVRLRIENSVYVPRDYAELADVLVQLRSGGLGFDADTPVVIHAGDLVPWDHVVNAFNAARRAGYASVNFGAPRSGA